MPNHDHAHDHSHDHSHAGSSYIMEQLCTIGVAGAYAIMLTVLFIKTTTATESRTLLSIIAPWIQWTVLIGSWVLLLLVLLRAAAVWRSAGAVAVEPHHHHEHEHKHLDGQEHELPCDHDHGTCGHDHSHDHEHHVGHAHVHHHDHHADHGHDHDWSPWRYAVMVFPLVLFFLPIDWDQKIRAFESDLIVRRGGEMPKYTVSLGTGEAAASLGTLSTGAWGLSPAGGLQYAIGTALDLTEQEAPGEPDARTDIGTLEKLANGSGEQQEQWRRYRRVELQGMFSPANNDGRVFQVVRLRMACCLSDARPAIVLGLTRKSPQVANHSWITVQGRLEFTRLPDGKAYPVIKAISIKNTPPPANPYLDS